MSHSPCALLSIKTFSFYAGGRKLKKMHSPILLTTLNARYCHSSFGLRYLFANLKELRAQTHLMEFTISQNPINIAESILAHQPRMVAFGVYIWNSQPTYEVISLLKRIQTELLIVLGGPEVSHEAQEQAICQRADYILQGEADLLFAQFCRNFLLHSELPAQKWIQAQLPDVKELLSPYSFYSTEDIQNRVIYVEASRGCPYRCEYCLSSLDKSVRSFDLDLFLIQMEQLIQRGARQFKFIDRTFNLSTANSSKILNFFLERVSLGLFLHFEMVPDRLPSELRNIIRKFPQGSLQFEIGIQTWSPQVGMLVNRRQDYKKIIENFEFLTRETGVHIHADLIAGLPGETWESFARGFDAVSELHPNEIQVGILKRLKGTPIVQQAQKFEMVYAEHPPFQILKTKTMSFSQLQQIHRFSQFWNLYANSGNFSQTLPLLQQRSKQRDKPSWFFEFFEFTLFLSKRHPEGNGISLLHLVESAWVYLTEIIGITHTTVRSALIQDYTGSKKRDIPSFLKLPHTQGSSNQDQQPPHPTHSKPFSTPKRQLRHLNHPEH